MGCSSVAVDIFPVQNHLMILLKASLTLFRDLGNIQIYAGCLLYICSGISPEILPLLEKSLPFKWKTPFVNPKGSRKGNDEQLILDPPM